MSAEPVAEAAEAAEPFQSIFVGLPEADAPAGPGEPGGPDDAYDPAVWRPRSIEMYRLDLFDGYMKLQTASEVFNVQRERLQRACERGALPAMKIADHLSRAPKADPSKTGARAERGTWMVHIGDVARYLASTLRGRPPEGRAKEASAGRRGGGGAAQAAQETPDRRTQRKLELERLRLLDSAEAAERRARELRAQLDAVSEGHPGLSYDARRQLMSDLPLRVRRDALNASNRRRLAADIERQQLMNAEAARRQAALEHGATSEA